MIAEIRRCHKLAPSLRPIVAMVYGSETATQKDKSGKPVAHCLTWTDTWLKRDGKWQIIGAQDAQFQCK